jgi:hypothetical protein
MQDPSQRVLPGRPRPRELVGHSKRIRRSAARLTTEAAEHPDATQKAEGFWSADGQKQPPTQPTMSGGNLKAAVVGVDHPHL